MSLTMADSVTVADLPTGMDAYAAYLDGGFANYPELMARFPTSRLLSISTRHNYDPAADVLDVESADALDSDAPGFVEARSGLRVLYRQQSSVVNLMAALGSMPRSHYKLWTAHYNSSLGEHICGPGTCGIPWQADGTQWTDTGPYDLSILADNFFITSPKGADMFIEEKDGTVYQLIYGGTGTYWRKVPVKPTQYPVEPDPNGTWLELWKH